MENNTNNTPQSDTPSDDNKKINIASNQDHPSKPMPSNGDGVCLERRIGLFSATMVILGNIIGSGIFLTPTGVFNNVGSVGLSMIVWSACGIFSTIGALCFAELGTTIESSGAEYSYIKECFGNVSAFLVLWANLIIIVPTGQMIVALTCAYYIVEPLYPDPDCPPPEAFVQLIAVLVVGKFDTRCILSGIRHRRQFRIV